MSQFNVLDSLVASGNGYLCTSQALSSGVSKPTLAEFVSKRRMKRVAQGIYLAEDAWPDELYQLSVSNARIVYSHETALSLHGLMEREPKYTSVTVKAGYNATHLRKKGIRVYQVKADVAELGAIDVQTSFGNTVRAYDMDRTICDILRNKSSMDIQIFQFAMKEYMASKQKNLNRLMVYAKKLQIDDLMRTYTEVLL